MFTIPISSLSLSAIFELVGLNNLCWSILHIWAISKQDSELDIFRLEEKTKYETGYQLAWDELIEISKNLDQVNECTIVAINPSKQLPERSLSQEELRNRCDIVIEAVDSTTWEISVQNEQLSRKLAKILSRTLTQA